MFNSLYPGTRAVSSYDFDFSGKYLCGYRGIIFDIDNTLVEHGADADARAVELIRSLVDMGYKICFLSNNKEPRVQRFCDGLSRGGVDMHGVFHISKAGKPSVKNYNRAMELMGTLKENTLFVGDQLFTDVWGANKAGISTVLVDRIDDKEEIQIVLKRYLEKAVLACYSAGRQRKRSGKAVVLIGFMGCGKTTVGQSLCKELEYEFVDMDKLIEEHENMSVSEIFDQRGEDYFRRLETEAISGKFRKLRNCVISTGGGMPIRPANHQPLKDCGIVVYLKTKPETILNRLDGDNTRPLLQRPDKEEFVKNLMAEREPVYSKLADITILTDGKNVSQIIHEIKHAL
ncbi:MAG: HAD-IIIA family hydrolase [Lachnospiraceae bacterium]